MAASYVGLDVHCKQTQFVIEGEDGRVMGSGEVATSPGGLALLASRHGVARGTKVALESGTMANYVTRLLQELGLEPVVVDAAEVRAKASRPRQKSDRRDALEICEGLRRNQYRSIVHIPPLEIQVLRDTLSRRRHFVRLQTAEVNAVKHLLRASGLRHLIRQLQGDSAWRKLVAQAEEIGLRSRIECHYLVWRAAEDQIRVLENSLAEQSQLFEADFLRLQTMPGVGPIVALTTYATFFEPERFPDVKHAASYVGLVPSTNQSGDRDWHGRITKTGSSELRSMLCEAAHQVRRGSHPLNPYFRSLCVRRGYKMAVVTVAHRMCRILYAMLRDKTEFDITKLGIEVGPFEKKIVTQYRLRHRVTTHA